MSKQPDPTIQDARVLDEAAVIVLDRLAVEGGHAQRTALFDRCKPAFWGRMVNAAARRAGYDGHDEDEVERRGREHLFFEAVNRLLERQVIVVWDEEGDVLALHPTHREPLREGGPPYVPGTEFWRTQREQALTELRTQLIQLRDGPFGIALQKTAELYMQQIRRGQLADDSREEALGALLGLADVLFQPSRLAQLLHIPEGEVTDAWRRRLAPLDQAPVPLKRAKRSTVKLVSEFGSFEPERALPSEQSVGHSEPFPPTSNGATSSNDSNGGEDSIGVGEVGAAWLKQQRVARNWKQIQMADIVGVSNSQVGYWERGDRPIPEYAQRRFSEYFAEHPLP